MPLLVLCFSALPILANVVNGNINGNINDQESCPSLVKPPYVEFPQPCGSNAGDRCFIGCERGFELIGSCHRTCCLSGKWTGYQSRCINRAIQCPALVPPFNGIIVDSCLNFAGSTCSFQCYEGSQITGFPTTDCLMDGTWSSPSPSCGPITPTRCYDLNPPENGAARGDCTNATTKLVCRFECDPGYIRIGVSQLTCLVPSWNGRPPTCEPVNCPNVNVSANGMVSGQCLPGLVGQSCLFSCDPGFKLSTSYSVVTCLATRQWDLPLPTCQQVTCGQLATAVANGGLVMGDCARARIYDFCVFRCNDGYAISGHSVVSCQPDGSWSGRAPTCSPLICRSLSIDPQQNPGLVASGDCDPGLAGRSCSFSCQLGFRFKAVAGVPSPPVVMAKCDNQGNWDKAIVDLPQCEIFRCPPLTRPENAVVQCNKLSNNCTVTCDTGYQTRDGYSTTVVTCDPETETWDLKAYECLAITCQPLSAPDDGSASEGCITAFSGQRCTFTCYDNFALSRPGFLTCKSGVWSRSPPKCVRIMCPDDAPDVEFATREGPCGPGIAGQSCVYTCQVGYALVGRPDLPCMSNNMWAETAPTCIRKQCPPLEMASPNGHLNEEEGTCAWLVGAICTVTCDTNFVALFATSFQCQDDGTWLGLNPEAMPSGAPICVSKPPIQCMPPKVSPANGIAIGKCNPGEVTQTCIFQCGYGYKLEGPMSATCNINLADAQNGAWDSKEPTLCSPIYCPALQTPSNGVRLNGNCIPGDVDMTCNFGCNIGFRLQGEGTLRCQGDGRWSSDPPTCVRTTCPSLLPPQPGGNLQGACQPGVSGEPCLFFCPQGYRLSGHTNLICQNTGLWDADPPICAPAARVPRTEAPGPADGTTVSPGSACRSIVAPRGGSMSGACDPGRVGETCTLRCPPGYRGSTTVSCQYDGTWFPSLPTCSRVSQCPPRRRCCPQVVAPRFGRIMGCSIEVGGQCRMSCNSGYSPTFRGPMTCMQNRRWNMNMTQIKCNQRLATTPSPRFWLRRTRRRG